MLTTKILPTRDSSGLHKTAKMNRKSTLKTESGQSILTKALQQPLILAPTTANSTGRYRRCPNSPTSSLATCDSDLAENLDSRNFPDHLGCGEVFTWHCEGEFYAVECRLCDDHPLCPLSEFPLHMEAWHTEWTGRLTIDGEELEADSNDGDEQENTSGLSEEIGEEEQEEGDYDEEHNDLYHVLALTNQNNEDSGLCEYDHDEPNAPTLGTAYDEDEHHQRLLEPFEQVLIEQEVAEEQQQQQQQQQHHQHQHPPQQEIVEDHNEEESHESQINENSAVEQRGVAITPRGGEEDQLVAELVVTDVKTNNTTVLTAAPQTQQQTNSFQNRKSKQYPTESGSCAAAGGGETLERKPDFSPSIVKEEYSLREYNVESELREFILKITGEPQTPTTNTNNSNSDGEILHAASQVMAQKEKDPLSSSSSFCCCWDKNKHDHQHEQQQHQHHCPKESCIGKPELKTLTGEIKKEPEQVKQDLKQKQQIKREEAEEEDEVEVPIPIILETCKDSILEEKVEAPTPISSPPLPTIPEETNTAARWAPSRKRKCRRNSQTIGNVAKPAPSKYLSSYQKFLETTATTAEVEPEINSSPEPENEPKRRRTYSRACKKSTPSAKIQKATEELQINTNLDQGGKVEEEAAAAGPQIPYNFLTPSQSEISSASSPNSEKSQKIHELVKQCERIAREHNSSSSSSASSASSTISSISNKTRELRRQTNNRHRRSLTPVEVCDIQPTVPLNDHLLNIYDESNGGNMSPQSLSEHLESLACSLLDCDEFPDDDDRSVASTTLTGENLFESSPPSPASPRTEEEHFEFHEPREKLNKIHVMKLIELYKQQTRLWDQSHTEFCEPHLCRQSWEYITERWNAFCDRKFHITEVRIRISTLCQRYLKERERIQRNGDREENIKFPYYKELSFLEQHRSLQKRREVYEQQNDKILDIYQRHLILWHVRYYKVRQVKERNKAFQSISVELKNHGIYLSSSGVQKRIRSLRKCYRLEKIRYLRAQVEKTEFVPTFKHYAKMQFLEKHIEPFVCRLCGKIFESLPPFKDHVETSSHGNILEEEDDEELEILATTNSLASTTSPDTILCGNNGQFEISMQAGNQNSVNLFIKPLPPQGVNTISAHNQHPTTLCDSTISGLPTDDQLMEGIIQTVSNDDDFVPQTLDTYVHSYEDQGDVTAFLESAANNIGNATQILTASDQQCTEDPVAVFNENLPKILGRRRSTKPKSSDVVDDECHSGDGDAQCARLSDDEIRLMISVYRRYRQLWDPNHLDYNTRSLRRQAWFSLTSEFNKILHRNFSWRSLYRKLIDYAKYYKKLVAEQSPGDIKWAFYKDLTFLDDVIGVSNEMGKSIHDRSVTLKLIEIYKDLPQLWNTRDPDYNKRPVKQRNINIVYNRLIEGTNKQISPERIKNRIIELRTQYRADKKKRIRCLNNKQKFFPDFEYYEEFNFIDAHIDPFECEFCGMDFKKLKDFNCHLRKEHEPKRRKFRGKGGDEASSSQNLDNVCHICGAKFSNRGNLGHHLIRHEGVRNFACTMCPKKFFNSHSLKIHVRSHTKECPYVCEKCGLSFVNASKLNQHVLRHTGKKDFKCDHCPKAFFTAFERDRHTRWHLNIRDKNCPICGKSFVKGSSYYAHLMLHSDTKRFKCDSCDKQFSQYAGLYKHRKRYHSP
ncbi:uncharacterized protein LOC101899132 [Musca domestica]|uniref:Uncharacterized protein LOC101899132 n=1 Tax=Musca domestica TaxID=7370 RepID=A0ABM3UY01_MUSDO|nr:uncharacterized protein LOC101899132 [Musca domestica]